MMMHARSTVNHYICVIGILSDQGIHFCIQGQFSTTSNLLNVTMTEKASLNPGDTFAHSHSALMFMFIEPINRLASIGAKLV